MKKLFLFFLLLFLTGCSTSISTQATTPTQLKIAVTSDLHYVSQGDHSDAIVPLVKYSDDFTEALVNEIIDQDFDVFIMTGDLTNDGNPIDEVNLSKHLQRLKDNGITVILTTGNHDYNQSDASVFEENYFPLFTITDRDPNSLSYSTVINHVRFLAMDDGYETNGEIGSFSKETMQWLEQQLKTAKQNQEKVIFLSHHSVLFHDTDAQHRYSITNSELISLLQKYDVKFMLTGHQHSQSLLQLDDMYEVISAMPMSGSHLYGIVNIENQTLTYHTKQIDFETYASDSLLEVLSDLEENSFTKTKEVFVPIFTEQGIDTQIQDGIFSLFARFMIYAQEGSLSSHYEEIKNDPYLEDMLNALKDYNYGPWMEYVLENPPVDATSLTFTW